MRARSVRVRLALVVTAVTVVVVAGGGWLFVHELARSLDRSVDAGLRAQSEGLASALKASSGSISQASTQAAPTAPASQALSQVLAPDGTVLDASGVAPTVSVLHPAALAAALRAPVWTTISLGEAAERVRLLAVPVDRTAGPVVAAVGASLEENDNALTRVRELLVVGGALVVLIAAAGSWWLARAALAPVERLRRQVAELSEGEPVARLDVPPTGDELAALAATMNALLAQLQRALERERALVADAGHELRTPLAVLQAELELAGRPGRTPEQLQDAVSAAAEESDRLAHLAESLLMVGPDRPPAALADVDVGELVREVAARPGRGRGRGVRVEVGVEQAPLIVAGDAEGLRRAVDNLLDNALRHAPPDSVVVVRAGRRRDLVSVEVLDEGPGFPDDFLPHAFERFRRADPSRRRDGGGAGLGLSIVRALVEAHGGTATVANRAGGGAQARIVLPTK